MEGTQLSPTKGNLIASKKSLQLAIMGHDLMDRKRNILVREMMALIDKANALRGDIDSVYSKAYAALQNANITLGMCNSIAQSMPVERGLSMNFRSVMGVELPKVWLEDENFDLCYDFSNTNSAFDQAFLNFHRVKLMTVELAELENSIYRLAIAIKKTQSRANALKNIIIPNTEATCKYISNALEEKEREEFSRLKVIKNQRKNA